jgi:RHS repeat-associated protein
MDRMVALAQSTSASLKVTRAPASGRVHAHQPKPATADSRSTLASSFSIAQQNRSLLHRAATTLQPNVASRYHCNQQYSITAITSSTGAVQERYAYSAYGVPTIANASGTVLTASAQNNRYTYTGREWDNDIKQYHYRARMYDASLGRFCSRDPIGFKGSKWNLQEFLGSRVLAQMDPLGKISVQECNDVLNEWWTASGESLVASCKKAKLDFQKPVCKDCPKNQPSTAGCKKDSKGNYTGVEIVLCANDFKSKSTLLLNIKHEMQHVRDICTCKEGCLILAHEVGAESLEEYCKEKACLEIRACIVGDCEGKSTVVNPATNSSPMEDCVKDCAIWSVEYSPKCKPRAQGYVAGVWKQCYSTQNPLPSFPSNL